MRRLTLTTIAFAAFATLGLATPTDAEAGEIHLELSSTTEYAPDPSFDALSDDNVNGAGVLSGAYSFDNLVPFGDLRAYFEFNGTGRDRRRFDGAFDLDWSRGMYLVGADWGPQLFEFTRPFIRVSAGYVRQQLRVSPSEDSPTFEQREHDFATKNAVGLELFIPYGEDSTASFSIPKEITVGLSGKFGHIWHTPAQFDDMRAADGSTDADDSWSRSSVNLGELRSTGLFWDVGAFIRFGF